MRVTVPAEVFERAKCVSLFLGDATMAEFPKREADVMALAERMISGGASTLC